MSTVEASPDAPRFRIDPGRRRRASAPASADPPHSSRPPPSIAHRPSQILNLRESGRRSGACDVVRRDAPRGERRGWAEPEPEPPPSTAICRSLHTLHFREASVPDAGAARPRFVRPSRQVPPSSPLNIERPSSRSQRGEPIHTLVFAGASESRVAPRRECCDGAPCACPVACAPCSCPLCVFLASWTPPYGPRLRSIRARMRVHSPGFNSGGVEQSLGLVLAGRAPGVSPCL